MSPTPLLLLRLLAVREEPERDELVRRGYELLPNARWLEELERDRSRSFLGVLTPTPSATTAGLGPLVVDFERLDYDSQALYPGEPPVARDPNERFLMEDRSKRAEWIWRLVGSEILSLAPRRPWETWFPLPKPLHSRR